MPKPAPVAIFRGLPGHDSIRQMVERFASSRDCILTSSNNAALVHAREIVIHNDDWRYKFEDSVIEIKGLGELARVFCDFTDAPTLPVASLEVQAAIASIAAASLPTSSAYYDSRDLPGFHEALASTLQELRRWRMKPEALCRLRPKAAEIGELSRAFEDHLAAHCMTTLSHRVEAIVSAAPAAPNGLRHVYWVGETEWPPLYVDLIRWISAAGARVAVLVEDHPADEAFYPETRRLISQLPQAELRRLAQPAYPHSRVFAADSLEPTDVRIIKMPDASVECERAISEAFEARSVIFCRNIQDYWPHLHAAARRVGLQLALDRKQPLLDNPFARYFLQAVDVCATGSIELAASLAMSSYSRIQTQMRDSVYAAVRQTLRSDDPWSELQAGVEGLPRWYSSLAEWRQNGLEGARTLTDWILQLKQLTSKMPWLDASVESDSETKERDESARDSMIRSLEVSKINADPNRRMSLADFAKHLDATWRRAECWVRDRGDLKIVRSASEIGDVERAIVLGMVEGWFPRRRAEDPLLLDDDRRSLGLPDSYYKAEDDRREFHRLACSAKALVFTFPEMFDDGEQVESVFLDDIGGAREEVKLEFRFPRQQDARFEVDRLAAEAWYGIQMEAPVATARRKLIERAVENSRMMRVEDPKVGAMLRELPRPLLAGHLRSLARCGFQYMCRAKFGLSQQGSASAWDRLAEVVRKTKLAECVTVEALKDKLRHSLREYIAGLRGIVDEDDLVVLHVAGPKALDAFAEREIAAREVWGTMPVEQNIRLHEAGFRTEIPGPIGKVVFDERIDVLYRRGQDAMPMRLGYVSPSADDERLLQDLSLLFVLNPAHGSQRMAALDSIETGTRKAIARQKQNVKSDLRNAWQTGLHASTSSESAKPAIDWVASFLKEQIRRALHGDFVATPGEHCERCRFPALCRGAKFARLHASERTEELE